MTLRESLLLHEGRKLNPYVDSKGNITIGVGRNLTAKGISEQEMFAMMNRDIVDARTDAMRFPFYARLTPARQDVITELLFNMGLEKVLGFKQMIAALSRGDYANASVELLDSKWATDVGPTRATALAKALA